MPPDMSRKTGKFVPWSHAAEALGVVPYGTFVLARRPAMCYLFLRLPHKL